MLARSNEFDATSLIKRNACEDLWIFFYSSSSKQFSPQHKYLIQYSEGSTRLSNWYPVFAWRLPLKQVISNVGTAATKCMASQPSDRDDIYEEKLLKKNFPLFFNVPDTIRFPIRSFSHQPLRCLYRLPFLELLGIRDFMWWFFPYIFVYRLQTQEQPISIFDGWIFDRPSRLYPLIYDKLRRKNIFRPSDGRRAYFIFQQ